jgi:type IV pilus assembly protein PilW
LHIAVVARNGLLEKDIVTSACTTDKGTANNGPCAWDDTNVDAAPKIDLSNDPDWQHYRYRVFETIIPLRNMIWSKETL